ncbi:MAG TPA: DUF294 nucleotidyltransferase-like domain-containing protein, partial [Acidobacteriota bacterium]|nr:DUF294 nucleotidyltransferase-like domain-containing protein [Acidobacteriota bacterium]
MTSPTSPESLRHAIRVNFHCHSNLSDGSLRPEELAEELAASGVRYAALTDHDTIDGLGAFDNVLDNHGIGALTGVEITVEEAPEDLHILAFGFDPENQGLRQILRRRRETRNNGFRDDFRKLWGYLRSLIGWNAPPSTEKIMTGAASVIRAIHRAGGTAFLAHPLAVCPDMERLDQWLDKLKQLQLDGVECFYAGYPESVQKELAAMAVRHNLLVCAGTDFHGFDQPGLNVIASEMPLEHWEGFRRAHRLAGVDRNGNGNDASGDSLPSAPLRKRIIRPKNPALQWQRFIIRIVFPTLLTIVLSMLTIFGLILPELEKNLMDRKRDMIRELVYSTVSMLSHYESESAAGRISREEAQKLAISYIHALRYGSERKDYFWVVDVHPTMIMHPYRMDLNGSDLNDFTDVQGRRLFVEIVRVAREMNEGFVEYYWQWKDDPDRIVPKQSFVKLFEPWGWVIGTGIYLDDVNSEIRNMTGWLVRLSIGISAVIILLLAYIIRESLAIEKRRSRSDAALHDSHEKYAALVEATTEGTLMVLNGRCAYSNEKMAETLGYSAEELASLDFREIFPREAEDGNTALAVINTVLEGARPPEQFEGILLRKNGRRFRALCSITRIALGGETGFILVVRDVSQKTVLEEELSHNRETLNALIEKVHIGVFRVTAERDPQFLELNQAARKIFGFNDGDDPASGKLLSLIPDERQRLQIADAIESGAGMQNRTVDIAKSGGGMSFVSLSLRSFRDENGSAGHFDGIVEDKTVQKRSEEERDTLLGELQSELLFMNEPMNSFARELILCRMNTSIHDAAGIMARAASSILGVTDGDSQNVIGILTDRDLRNRVLAAEADMARPVYEIMSSPVISLPENAAVFEAIMKMEQSGVNHIVLRNTDGRIHRLVGSSDLMRLHRYSSAVITGELQKARSVADIIAVKARLPWLIKTLLNCGARPRIINRIMTRISDIISERLIAFAIEEAGPPPAAHCFMALGSEGRGEQTLVTDQDNALIWDDRGQEDVDACREYFLRVGISLTEGLNKAGYEFCPGEVMARNPKWNRPLRDWKVYFRDWITQATPQDLLEFNTFFDFRFIWGERDFARRLRGFIHELINEHPTFLIHFAQNALLYKPPIGLFGKIVGESDGESQNAVNLKEAMLPIVNFARLYSLRHAVGETVTLDRLHRLFELQIIKKTFYDEV